MADRQDAQADAARVADHAAIPALLSSTQENVLRALIENPALEEEHVVLLLKRSDLPGPLLEEIAKKKAWRDKYQVSLALAANPHTPRIMAQRLLKDIHLMDLVRISLQPGTSAELRRLAEDRIIAQLPQLPLGQRLVLARRCSGRVAAGVVLDGPIAAIKLALDNPLLTEAHLLKTLANESVSAQTVAAIAHHRKWSFLLNVRVAVVRHKNTPVDRMLVFLRELPRLSIEDLLEAPQMQGSLREFLRQELIRRDSKE